jgi:hypothetical protein
LRVLNLLQHREFMRSESFQNAGRGLMGHWHFAGAGHRSNPGTDIFPTLQRRLNLSNYIWRGSKIRVGGTFDLRRTCTTHICVARNVTSLHN